MPSYLQIGVVTAGVVSTASALLLYASYLQSKDQKQPVQKMKKKRRKVPKDMPSDGDLLKLLQQAFRMLQVQSAKGETQSKMYTYVRGMIPKKFSPRTRILAAQWLLAYRKVCRNDPLILKDPMQRAILAANKEDDYQQAWSLLAFDVKGDVKNVTLLLESALGLKNGGTKLVPLFEALMAKEKTMPLIKNELLIALSVAPVIGRWAKALDIGKKLFALGVKEQALRFSSLRYDTPDLSVLYNMSAELAKKGDAKPNEMVWKNYKIVEQKIICRKIECKDEAKLKKLEAAQTLDTWMPIPCTARDQVIRTGLVIQRFALASGDNRVKLTGVVGDKTMEFRGVFEMATQGAAPGKRGPTFFMKETMKLKLANSDATGSTWTGTLLVDQGPATPTAGGPTAIKSHFEMEMKLAH